MHRSLLPSGLLLVTLAFWLAVPSCGPGDSGTKEDEGQVVKDGRDLNDNPEILSPPILGEPIYECTNVVFVQGFVPGAEVLVFADADPSPIGGETSIDSSGATIKVKITFTKGQVITARQRFKGVTSGPSNAVTVRSHKDDYPGGLPKPRIDPPPLYRCGRATGSRDQLPGSHLEFQSEPPLGGGGFGPAVTIASMDGAAPAQWMSVSPPFELGARVRSKYRICTDDSPLSDGEIVQEQPAVIPPPTIDQGYEGQEIIVVRNIVNGAMLDVYANIVDVAHRIGGSPTPGGSGQRVRVSPKAVSGDTLIPTQGLCDPPVQGPGMTVKPCSELPAAKINPPAPGDTQVEVTESVPGAEIQIYANGEKVGDGGGSIINLVRPLNDGEVVKVVQILGNCKSQWVFQVGVKCRVTTDIVACSGDWPAFRHNSTRNAQQTKNSALADPFRVRTLKVKWQYPLPGDPSLGGGFRASPIIYKGKLYVGNGNGRLYALDASNGNFLWKYPPDGQPALTSRFTSNPSSLGIASSAAIGRVRKDKEVDAVIFGAPDQSLQPGFGSGRLFALDANTGVELWKSPAVAVLEGDNTTGGSLTVRHEQIGYSSPLILNGKVYIGIANHGDNPIQNGKVVAVDLNSGAIVGGFSYQSTNTRGGGVWSSVAGGPSGELYITTGNVRNGNPGGEPSVNNGLSMLRLDPASGAIIWKFQPVPFALDDDPDWSSGPTAIKATCATLAASTQKDGWSYAVNAGSGSPGTSSVRWQFPPTAPPPGFLFTPGDGTSHSDTRYLVPGAAWRDVFITMSAGVNVITNVSDGFTRLHGLNVCPGDSSRIRWLFDVPDTSPGSDYQLGPPTVTRGIVFVGTAQGHVVAFADPSAAADEGLRCSNPRVANADCVVNGFQLVPQPHLLRNVSALLDGSRILTEPALAGGRVYVSTEGGHVFMLEP